MGTLHVFVRGARGEPKGLFTGKKRCTWLAVQVRMRGGGGTMHVACHDVCMREGRVEEGHVAGRARVCVGGGEGKEVHVATWGMHSLSVLIPYTLNTAIPYTMHPIP